ncbi:MAG: TetR/AcrR family transcriptional regulator, partial [Bacteroidota bacterium]
IITAATDLFQQEGYDKVSMRKIAKKIEYSVGTLYLYYEDKDELFLAVQEAAFGKAFIYIQQVGDSDDPMELLERLGERYLRFGVENPGLYRLMFMSDQPMKALSEEDDWRAGIRLHQLLSNLVERCIKEGKLPAVDADKMSFILWSTVHGMVSLQISSRLSIYSGCNIAGVPEVEDSEAWMHDAHKLVLDMLQSIKS